MRPVVELLDHLELFYLAVVHQPPQLSCDISCWIEKWKRGMIRIIMVNIEQ